MPEQKTNDVQDKSVKDKPIENEQAEEQKLKQDEDVDDDEFMIENQEPIFKHENSSSHEIDLIEQEAVDTMQKINSYLCFKVDYFVEANKYWEE